MPSPFFIRFIVLLAIGFFWTQSVIADEEHAATPEAKTDEHKTEDMGGEKKKEEEEKPRPDSAISIVMSLPEVKTWTSFLDSVEHKTLQIWGESIQDIKGNKCWGIAAGVSENDNTKVWARFCVTQGGSVWVEKNTQEGITMVRYDDWKKDCHPTYGSPGICN